MKKVIDVSDWQEGLDYDKVVEAGIEGVIIKICESTWLTESWWSHLAEVQQRGLPWGVYCYGHAKTPDEARAEANEVLYLLNGRVPPMGVWYDVEDDDMFAEGVDTTACASAFIIFMNEHGLRCNIYTSSLKCTDYMVNSLRPRLLADYLEWWIADYRGFNEFVRNYPDKTCAGWQYTCKGNIGGVEVDISEWYSDF